MKYIQLIVILLLILFIAASSSLCYNVNFMIGALVFLGLVAFRKGVKLDSILILIILYMVGIEIISTLYIGDEFRITRIFNYLYPVLIAYFSLKICGEDSLDLIEKVVFVLTICATILFGLQLLYPTFFESLSTTFSKYLAEPYQDREPSAWYAYIYRYMPRDDYSGMIRNSGFMWEPGAFAWVAATMLFYRWIQYGISLKDWHFWIYVIAILTTFSTAGYLALICAGFYYTVHLKSKFMKWIIAGVFILYLVPLILNLDFMTNKINSYLVGSKENDFGYHPETNTVEYNRYMFFMYTVKKIIAFPLGYGTHEITTPMGFSLIAPNGLGNLLYRWGIFGLGFLLFAIYKFFNSYGSKLWYHSLIATVAITILLFSNPAHVNALLFILVLYPFMYKKTQEDEGGSSV